MQPGIQLSTADEKVPCCAGLAWQVLILDSCRPSLVLASSSSIRSLCLLYRLIMKMEGRERPYGAAGTDSSGVKV